MDTGSSRSDTAESTSVTSVLPEGPCLVRSVICSPQRSPLRRLSVTVVPAFAADQPILTGTVLDAAGQPFPVEDGTLKMTAPDGGGIYGTQVSVGGDGSFEVEVMPWGTEATPAEVTISITGVAGDTEVNATGCTDQFAPVAESTFQVALESGVPEPVVLVAEERLIGTVCGEGSSPGTTLPPSEVQPSEAPPSAGAGRGRAGHAGPEPGARGGRTRRPAADSGVPVGSSACSPPGPSPSSHSAHGESSPPLARLSLTAPHA